MPMFEGKNLTDDEKELLRNYRNLAPKNRANLITWASVTRSAEIAVKEFVVDQLGNSSYTMQENAPVLEEVGV